MIYKPLPCAAALLLAGCGFTAPDTPPAASQAEAYEAAPAAASQAENVEAAPVEARIRTDFIDGCVREAQQTVAAASAPQPPADTLQAVCSCTYTQLRQHYEDSRGLAAALAALGGQTPPDPDAEARGQAAVEHCMQQHRL